MPPQQRLSMRSRVYPLDIVHFKNMGKFVNICFYVGSNLEKGDYHLSFYKATMKIAMGERNAIRCDQKDLHH